MLRLLSNDEGESFEDGVVPISLEMDDHVCYLGEVEFDTVEDLTGAGELQWAMRMKFRQRMSMIVQNNSSDYIPFLTYHEHRNETPFKK